MALASPLVLVSFCFSGFYAELMFTVLAMGYPVALITLAVARDGQIGVLAVPMLLLGLILEVSALAMLYLQGRVMDGPWIGGMPLGMAVQLYGLWLAPLPIVALAYALTFDRFELREDDLQKIDALIRDDEVTD